MYFYLFFFRESIGHFSVFMMERNVRSSEATQSRKYMCPKLKFHSDLNKKELCDHGSQSDNKVTKLKNLKPEGSEHIKLQ